MRYAIPVNGRLAQIADVPSPVPYGKTPEQFLALMFPNLSGWVQVSDDNVSGASDNGDGTYTNPTSEVATQPVVFKGADWREYAYGILGTIAAPNGTAEEKLLAGLKRYGEILVNGRASITPETVATFDQYDDATNFRFDKVTLFLQVLVSDGQIVTPTEYAAIIGNWPQI